MARTMDDRTPPRRRSHSVATGLLLASLAPLVAACGNDDAAVSSTTAPDRNETTAVEMVEARIVDRLPEDPALRFSSYADCTASIGADHCDATPATAAPVPGVCSIDDPHGASGSWSGGSPSHGSHAVFIPSYGYRGYYPVFSGGSARVAAPAGAGIAAFSTVRAGGSPSVSTSARGGFGGIGASAVAGG